MAESEPIKYSDIVEPGTFEKLTSDAKEFEAAIKQLNTVVTTSAKGSAKRVALYDEKDVDIARKYAAEIDKMRAIQKGRTEAEKLLASAMEQNKQALKKINDEDKLRIQIQNAAKGSVTEMRLELKKISQEWANLSEAERENTERGKALTSQKLELTNKLKKLEEATGDHRRSVGDYAKGLKGLSEVLKITATSLGINAELVEKVEHFFKGGAKVIKEYNEGLHHIGAGHKKAADGAADMAEQQTKVTSSFGSSIPMAALVIGAITAITYAYTKHKEEEKEIIEATQELNAANNELTKSFNELNEAIHTAAIRELETIKKVMQARLQANGVTEAGIRAVGGVQTEIDKKQIEEKEKQIEANIILQEKYSKIIEEIESEAGRNLVKLRTKQGDEYVQAIDEKEKLINDAKLARFRTELNGMKAQGIKLRADLKELQGQLIVDQIEIGKDVNDLNKDITDKNKKIWDEYWKEYLKKMQDAINAQIKTYNDDWEKYKKFMKDKNALFFDNYVKEAQLSKDKKKIEDAEYQKRVDDLVQRSSDEIKKTKEYQKALELLKKEHEQKLHDIEKEERTKAMEEKIAMEEKMFQSFFSAIERRINMQKEYGQYEISLLDSQIQQQVALATQGQQNTLAATVRAKEEAIAQQKELERKARREAEAQQLAQIFLEYQKAYAKDGAAAAQKALADTLIAKGISEGLAAAFAEEGGVLGEGLDTDYKLFSKSHKTGKEVVVQAQEGEGFVSLKDMAALRQGIIPGWMKKVYNPAKQDGMLIQQGDTAVIAAKLDDLAKAMQNSPRTIISKDLHGNIVITNESNGISQRNIQTKSPIIKR